MHRSPAGSRGYRDVNSRLYIVTPCAPPDGTRRNCGPWDTRWMGYAGNHDIRVIADGEEGQPDSWNGINAPPATDLKLTQKCWDVTGTVSFAMDPVCTGTVNGKIEKNQLSGTWKTVGCEPEDKSTDGKFTLTMAADNKTWTGKLIGTQWLDWCSDCPPNWAGRRM